MKQIGMLLFAGFGVAITLLVASGLHGASGTHVLKIATLAPEGSAWMNLFEEINAEIMQKTNNACSILLSCSWEDMGTHAALIEKIGREHNTNVTVGKTVVTGRGNRVLAATDQCVVVGTDDISVVVTNNTVFVGDKHTDMKALVETVARHRPDIV